MSPLLSPQPLLPFQFSDVRPRCNFHHLPKLTEMAPQVRGLIPKVPKRASGLDIDCRAKKLDKSQFSKMMRNGAKRKNFSIPGSKGHKPTTSEMMKL
ncbi:unnamed protein product [Caenorhabditis auriculariae]|uniref:Uncharacterized protein n=1 Tax=Caenorhabditis auriculariae TaxID=2777116 RepID=A0A8S1H1P6_9PELO|nr:unnamed protein product [Caenorhabditis auriculariae]